MITLKDMTLDDLPLFAKWLENPRIAKWYEHPDAWITEVREQDGKYNWIRHYVVMAGFVPIGFCQYYACKDSDEVWEGYFKLEGVYSIDYLIGEDSYLGKGLGTEIVHKLVDRIKENHDAKTVIVQPDMNNALSRATLLSAGFTTNNESGILFYNLSRD